MQSAKSTPQAAQPEVTGKAFYPQIPQIGADFLREGSGSKLPLHLHKDDAAVGTLLADAQEILSPYFEAFSAKAR